MTSESREPLDPLHSKPYQYLPLSPNEIRVLDLLPGTSEDQIIINIRHTALQDPLDKECTALSYTWGDPQNSRTIYCSEEQGYIIVTNECFSALRRLRLPDKSKTLWVDAISINQRDIPERNHQVTLMSKIYHLSTKVAIYLGEESFDSKIALKYITDHAYSRLPMGLANMSLRTMEGIRNLFLRPWFFRVWVIQEARNAQSVDVYCGDEVFDWKCILSLPWNAPYFPESTIGRQPYVALPPSTYWKQEEYAYIGDVLSPETLFQHLLRARSCLATDPRDKVFALLPLLKDSDEELAKAGLLPDYSQETEKVFMNVAKYLIGTVGWGLLYAVEGGSTLDLPSWCPDWSILPKTPFLYRSDRIPCKMDFPQPNSNTPTILPNNTLLIHAIRHSTIAHLAVPCDLTNPEWPSIIFKTWHTFNLATFPLYYTERFPSTESTDPEIQPGEDADYFLQSVYSFIGTYLTDSGFAKNLVNRVNTMNAYVPAARHPSNGENQGAKQTLDRFRQRCQGQRVFFTGKGEFGLAPMEAKIGDLVVCLEGGTVPFLLREVEGGKVRLVGKCEVVILHPKELYNSHVFKEGTARGREFVDGVFKGDGVLEEFIVV